MTDAERMRQIFDGYDRAFGMYNGISDVPDEKGKLIGSEKKTVHAALMLSHYERHLKGECGIGVVPIRADNTASWGAIDVDEYDGLNLQALAARVARLTLPLVPVRSKSGGCHLYMFLDAPAPARAIIDKLKEYRAFLGFGLGVEIFPKQAEILAEKGDAGSWINIPYFGPGWNGGRYAIDADSGDALTLDQFFDLVEKRKVAPDFLGKPMEASTELLQGPPCLQHLIQLGFPTGSRNNALLSLGVYAKKSDPDNWEGLVDAFNRKYMQPPLSSEEVTGVIKSLKRKSYGYKCNDSPIAPHCNISVCRLRKHGIGRAGGMMPEFGRLARVNTDPPIWFWSVDGKRIQIDTRQLSDNYAFGQACLSQLSIMIPMAKKDDWCNLIREKLTDLDIIDVPVESTPAGQFAELLEKFCTGRAQAETRDELMLGRPLTENGRTYFRTMDVRAFLKRQGWQVLAENQWITQIKDKMSGTSGQYCCKGKTFRWWSVPAFEVQTEAFDLPKSVADSKVPF